MSFYTIYLLYIYETSVEILRFSILLVVVVTDYFFQNIVQIDLIRV